VLLRRHQTLVATHGAIHAGEIRQTFLHFYRQHLAQFVNIGYHQPHGFFVKCQRLRHVVKDADVIHNQAVRFFLAERAVCQICESS